MMEFEEFRTKVARPHERNFKVKGSIGVYDIYKAIRKKGWYDIGRPVKEHEFYAVIRGVNDLLAKEIAKGNTVKFPERMGVLELRKIKRGVSMVNGKLKNTYPINWDATLKLWFSDEKAHKSKLLLRNEEDYIYHVKYNKYDANYENKCFYEFTLNNFIKKALKENIKKGIIDTLW